MREAAEGERPKADSSGAKTSKQVCGRSSGGGGGDGGQSSPCGGTAAWTRASPRQSAGSDAERASTRLFPSRRVRVRDRDGPPSGGDGRAAAAVEPLPPPLLRRRRRDGDGDAAAGERPTRTPVSRDDRPFLCSDIMARMGRRWVEVSRFLGAGAGGALNEVVVLVASSVPIKMLALTSTLLRRSFLCLTQQRRGRRGRRRKLRGGGGSAWSWCS